MTLRRSVLALLRAAPLAALLAPLAAADHLILTTDLRLLRGTMATIGPQTVSFRDAGGQDVFLPADQCLGFVDLAYRPPGRSDPGLLLMADGQRLPGRPELRQGRLVWVNPLLGSVKLDLEQVKGLALRSGLEPPEATERDVVLLANGDRMEGIIEGLGTEVALSQDAPQGGAASTVHIPLERVDAIGLVSTPRAPHGSRIWLEDGTVADVERPIADGDGQVHLRGFLEAAETRAHGLPLSYLLGVRFSASGFVPLASLEPESVSAPPQRLYAPPPQRSRAGAPLGLGAVRLSGPIEVTWELPDGLRRLVATATIPDDVRAWADLELVVLDGQGERQRHRLAGDAPRLPLDVTLRDGTLTLRLEEGRRGPVGDTIVLETPVVGAVVGAARGE